MTRKKTATIEVKLNVVFREGHWWPEQGGQSWFYCAPGWYDPAVKPNPTIILDHHQVRQLITALDEEDWIQPRLDERLREEDLKITHRLLDVIQILAQPSGDQSPQICIKTPAEVIKAEA